MHQHVDEGTLSVLEVAFSRLSTEKIYVTHKYDYFLNKIFVFSDIWLYRLRDRGSEVASLILEQGAYIYVCGDGNRMAKDVIETLKDILMEHGKLSSDDAWKVFIDMRKRGRYELDIWSTS